MLSFEIFVNPLPSCCHFLKLGAFGNFMQISWPLKSLKKYTIFKICIWMSVFKKATLIKSFFSRIPKKWRPFLQPACFAAHSTFAAFLILPTVFFFVFLYDMQCFHKHNMMFQNIKICGLLAPSYSPTTSTLEL